MMESLTGGKYTEEAINALQRKSNINFVRKGIYHDKRNYYLSVKIRGDKEIC